MKIFQNSLLVAKIIITITAVIICSLPTSLIALACISSALHYKLWN